MNVVQHMTRLKFTNSLANVFVADFVGNLQ